jgi:hypothetical protein
MLVGHDPVEAYLVRQNVLFMVLVVQHMSLFRVEVCVGKEQSAGVILFQVFVPDVPVGLLGKPEHFDFVFGPG